MKATLEFNLPEEQEEYEINKQAYKMHAALWNVGTEVFRPARKHGYSDQLLNDLIFFLDQAAAGSHDEEKWPSDKYGPLGATDLIYLLEQKYHAILRENGVEL